jgi:hypothetical protein
VKGILPLQTCLILGPNSKEIHMSRKVIILRGINGSGKTHYLDNTLLNQYKGSNVAIVEFQTYFINKAKERGQLQPDGTVKGVLEVSGADMGRANGRMLREFTDHIHGVDVNNQCIRFEQDAKDAESEVEVTSPDIIIVDAMMLTKLELAPFGALALCFHYAVEVHTVMRPLDECFESGVEGHGKSVDELKKQLNLLTRENDHWPDRFPRQVINNSSTTGKSGGKVIRAGVAA